MNDFPIKNKDIIEYLYQSYVKVDGLWFIKVEEKYGFKKALQIDSEVWKILPKIQARFLKSKLKKENGIAALYECLNIKLKLDNFKFKSKKLDNKNSFKIEIKSCPWHNIMIKSERKNLSKEVGSIICHTEYSVWASEFGENIHFEIKEQICKKDNRCIFLFKSL